MLFFKNPSFTALAATLIALPSILLVQATPVPLEAAKGATVSLSKRDNAGFNDWNCKPSKLHPNPLVLVHGLTANGLTNWLPYMGPRFVSEGYCVFSLSYGQLHGIPVIYGLDKMENSAQQLSDFVNKVLTATNATKVDMFGHSEGSLMPRYYFKFLGGGAKVCKFATIGPIVYGTDGLLNLLEPLGLYDALTKLISPICLSCPQLSRGSDFLMNLNAGGDTVPGIEYLMIVTKYDEMVTPYKTGFLTDNNPLVHNQLLQDWCKFDTSEHIRVALDPIVFKGVHAFFTPSADQSVSCLDAFK